MEYDDDDINSVTTNRSNPVNNDHSESSSIQQNIDDAQELLKGLMDKFGDDMTESISGVAQELDSALKRPFSEKKLKKVDKWASLDDDDQDKPKISSRRRGHVEEKGLDDESDNESGKKKKSYVKPVDKYVERSAKRVADLSEDEYENSEDDDEATKQLKKQYGKDFNKNKSKTKSQNNANNHTKSKRGKSKQSSGEEMYSYDKSYFKHGTSDQPDMLADFINNFNVKAIPKSKAQLARPTRLVEQITVNMDDEEVIFEIDEVEEEIIDLDDDDDDDDDDKYKEKVVDYSDSEEEMEEEREIDDFVSEDEAVDYGVQLATQNALNIKKDLENITVTNVLDTTAETGLSLIQQLKKKREVKDKLVSKVIGDISLMQQSHIASLEKENTETKTSTDEEQNKPTKNTSIINSREIESSSQNTDKTDKNMSKSSVESKNLTKTNKKEKKNKIEKKPVRMVIKSSNSEANENENEENLNEDEDEGDDEYENENEDNDSNNDSDSDSEVEDEETKAKKKAIMFEELKKLQDEERKKILERNQFAGADLAVEESDGEGGINVESDRDDDDVDDEELQRLAAFVTDDREAERDMRKKGRGIENFIEEENNDFALEVEEANDIMTERREYLMQQQRIAREAGMFRAMFDDDHMFKQKQIKQGMDPIKIAEITRGKLNDWERDLLRSHYVQNHDSSMSDSDDDEANVVLPMQEITKSKSNKSNEIDLKDSDSDIEIMNVIESDEEDVPNSVEDPDGHAQYQDEERARQKAIEDAQIALEIKHGKRVVDEGGLSRESSNISSSCELLSLNPNAMSLSSSYSVSSKTPLSKHNSLTTPIATQCLTQESSSKQTPVSRHNSLASPTGFSSSLSTHKSTGMLANRQRSGLGSLNPSGMNRMSSLSTVLGRNNPNLNSQSGFGNVTSPNNASLGRTKNSYLFHHVDQSTVSVSVSDPKVGGVNRGVVLTSFDSIDILSSSTNKRSGAALTNVNKKSKASEVSVLSSVYNNINSTITTNQTNVFTSNDNNSKSTIKSKRGKQSTLAALLGSVNDSKRK